MTPPPDLTQRQREVLAALERLTVRDGFPPTLREVAAEVGVASPSSVLHHVRVLEQAELLQRRPQRPRTLRATPRGSDALAAPLDVAPGA